MKYELIATTTFGLEAVARRELEKLGYEVMKTEDGKITYLGDLEAIAKSNLWLRTSDRVLLKMGETKVKNFEELFQYVKELPWEEIIPKDGCFVVNGTTVKSTLTSLPAIQRTIKKAMVLRLSEAHESELPETGAEYPIRFTLLKDVLTISIDTTGAGLHKRGYRVQNVEAPIKETLAAALIELSFWRRGRLLVDPCCGSGTILIEAAMIGRNIAPGLCRNFLSEKWQIIPEEIWKRARKDSAESADYEGELSIRGYDIDSKAAAAAEANADAAGVRDDICFERMSVSKINIPEKSSIIITNPPYGQRIGSEEEMEIVDKALRRLMSEDESLSVFAITSEKGFEKKMGRKADRRRKLYNGRIETTYYQYHGKKQRP